MNAPGDPLAVLPVDPGDLDGVPAVDPEPGPQREGFLAPGEAEQLRRQKLMAIRQAIADGSYDTDEMLDKALMKMLPHLDGSAPA